MKKQRIPQPDRDPGVSRVVVVQVEPVPSESRVVVVQVEDDSTKYRLLQAAALIKAFNEDQTLATLRLDSKGKRIPRGKPE